MGWWYSMSVGFLQDPKVEQLGERHGPAGPLVIVDLLSAAALAGGETGEFERSYRTIAIGAHTDRQEAEAIIASAVEIGLVTEVSQKGHGVSLAFPEWKKWQQNGRQAKSREAKKEARKPLGNADVTESHRPVTDLSPTDRQTKRQTEKSSSAPASIIEILDRVAFSRGRISPKPDAVENANAAHPAAATEAEAEKFAHYWIDGPGCKRDLDDIAWTWRGWLERTAASSPKETEKPSEKYGKYDKRIRRAA